MSINIIMLYLQIILVKVGENMIKKGRQIPIKRENPNRVIPTFVNDMIVTHSQHEFYITFSVIEPPGILSENEFDQIESVDESPYLN